MAPGTRLPMFPVMSVTIQGAGLAKSRQQQPEIVLWKV